MIAALFIVLKKPRDRIELLLLGIAMAYFSFASFFGSLQIGIRYLLPVYPICFVLFGKVGALAFSKDDKEDDDDSDSDLPKKRGPMRTLKLTMVLCGCWLLIDHVMIWPDYLAYFNAFAGGPKNGYKALLDSNLDWGQDLPGLKKWMDKNGVDRIDLVYFGHDDPARFGIEYDLPLKETGNKYLAVSANYLTGRKYPMTYLGFVGDSALSVGEGYGRRGPFGITREELDVILTEVRQYRGKKPAAMIGYSIFVYNKFPGGR
jgi:hypothetical protein